MLSKIEGNQQKYFNTFHGFSVSRIHLDYSLTVLLVKDEEYKLLTIENNFIFSDSISELTISIETWGNVEKLRILLSESITDILFSGKSLHIQIGGWKLIIPPDEKYESWNISGKNGIEVVMLPGGDLSTYFNTFE